LRLNNNDLGEVGFAGIIQGIVESKS